MPYLPTHPRRCFREGDDVIHVGEGLSYRGKLGRVVKVSGSKANGNVSVLWDHQMTPQTYSIAWCKRMLGVHINCLRISYHDFNGRRYVDKYLPYAFRKCDVKSGFFIKPHADMKELVDYLDRQACENLLQRHMDIALARPFPVDANALLKGMQFSVRNDMLSQFQQNLMTDVQESWSLLKSNPGLFKLEPSTDGYGFKVILSAAKPAQPTEEKPVAKKEIKYPVLAECQNTGSITHIASEKALQDLGCSTYRLFSLATEIVVKPIQQKEIVFN